MAKMGHPVIRLKKNLERIRKLLDENTASSLTYAALECRIAIEQVCYDRLRIAHAYISHADLRRWQPKDVVQQLIQDVDKHTASTMTLSMSRDPVRSGGRELSKEDFESIEYTKIGTQIGFDPQRLGKLWNALSSFLHVKLPRNTETQVHTYGDVDKLRARLAEAINELERLSTGTMIMGGFGPTVSFECECGTRNKRRAELLKNGDILSCTNRDCIERWEVEFEADEPLFVRRKVSVHCKGCGLENAFPEKAMLDLELNKVAHFVCKCGEKNYVRWGLQQVVPAPRVADSTAKS